MKRFIRDQLEISFKIQANVSELCILVKIFRGKQSEMWARVERRQSNKKLLPFSFKENNI